MKKEICTWFFFKKRGQKFYGFNKNNKYEMSYWSLSEIPEFQDSWILKYKVTCRGKACKSCDFMFFCETHLDEDGCL